MSKDEILVKDSVDINKGRTIKARVKKYNGQYYFDLRIFSHKGNPTKQGLIVPIDYSPRVIDLAEDVYEEGSKKVDQDMSQERGKNMKRDLKALKKKYR